MAPFPLPPSDSPLRARAYRARLPSVIGACVLLVGGCGDGDPPPSGDPAPPAAPAVPLPVVVVGPDAALDVRLVPLFPERYDEQEALCDLAYVGQLRATSADEATRYPFPVALRATVRCQAMTGLGWADLVFSPGATSLSPYVVPGKRLRVAVRSARGGAEEHPVLEFVALVGDAASYPESDRAFAPVPAAFDFARLRREARRVGARETCAIVHAGPAEPIDPTLAPRYPPGATHHAVLSCQSARHEAWIDLAFTEETLLGALNLERGRLLPVRIEARRGGAADLPVVSYALR